MGSVAEEIAHCPGSDRLLAARLEVRGTAKVVAANNDRMPKTKGIRKAARCIVTGEGGKIVIDNKQSFAGLEFL
jgi:hypothetical protein